MGETAPSLLPPDKRGEMLTMYAEEASSGEHYNWAWYIVSDARKRKRLRLDRMPETPPESAIRFWPIFIVDHSLREIERGSTDIPEPLRRMLIETGKDMSPERRREHMRRAIAQILIMGGGYTSQEFERKTHENTRRGIQYIVESGGRASEP
jgi:hypothetical protein